jgi:acetylornithine aminotransferase/acetylornithine/N-succinyldiaminopimelate aminotransferase
MPIGAMLTTDRLAGFFVPGTHASTFGGNPVATAAGVAVMQHILADGFLAEVRAKGDYFRDRLAAVAKRYPDYCSGVRGLGLINGLVLTEAAVPKGADIVNEMLERGYLINFAGNTVLRFVPPLIVSREEIDRVVSALTDVFSTLQI